MSNPYPESPLPLDSDAVRHPSSCHLRRGIKPFLDKLNSSAKVSIGYIGGSITHGPWPDMVTRWLVNEYPRCSIQAFNAAIGGTCSGLGVFRLQHDLLSKKPDLVFVEFAVNDFIVDDSGDIVKFMDGIVQQTYRLNPNSGIVFVYTLRHSYLDDYRRGENPRTVRCHETIAERYGIPSINMGYRVAEQIGRGKLSWEQFASDGCHPVEYGHSLYAAHVTACFASMRELPSSEPGATWTMPPPVPGSYIHARLAPITPAELKCADPRKAEHAWDAMFTSGQLTDLYPERKDYYGQYLKGHMPQIWTLDRPGDVLRLEFHESHIGIYDLHGPDSGMISVVLDDKPIGEFDRYIPEGRTIFRLSDGLLFGKNLPYGRHRLVITLLDRRNKDSIGTGFRPGFWLLG